MRFINQESKFSGDMGKCWQEYVDEYRQLSADYGLSNEEKLQYLHKNRTKDAHRYYVDRVK